MQTTKKKPSILLITIGGVFAGYVGYLVGGAWSKTIQLEQFITTFTKICENPLGDYWNEYTLNAIASVIGIYLLLVIMYYSSQRKMMPGKEYGTASFAQACEINKRLKDKDPSFNRIYSQNVRMSLDTRKTKLNNNVLIVGGSGSGKTFFEVKPNLMQLTRGCSYIITDPKGGARRSRLKRASTAQI